MTKQDTYRPFHWPTQGPAVSTVEPDDENCPQNWNVWHLESNMLIGQVTKDGERFGAYGRVWDAKLDALVPLWFPGGSPAHPDYSSTVSIELALERIHRAWQQYTD